MEGRRLVIIDKNWNEKIVNVVESVDSPWLFWLVALNPDWTKIAAWWWPQEESFGGTTLWWTSDITTWFKFKIRAKKNWVIQAYRIDSYDTNGDPVNWDITYNITNNGVAIWVASMTWASTVYNASLGSWTTTIVKDDQIAFEVSSVSGVKNAIITIYYQ